MGTLYVVATPIGNLNDVSPRALEVLKSARVLFAEDTRVTKKLTHHFDIATPVKRYNEHAPEYAYREAERVVRSGGDVALVSDSGTPAISDPGGKLVAHIRACGARIVPVPGPSALTVALSAAGMSASEFTFLGFPPAKHKRSAFFKNVATLKVRPVVIYESPHRILKTLQALEAELGAEATVCVFRELTKVYEEIRCGTLGDAIEHVTENGARGEYVVVVS